MGEESNLLVKYHGQLQILKRENAELLAFVERVEASLYTPPNLRDEAEEFLERYRERFQDRE